MRSYRQLRCLSTWLTTTSLCLSTLAPALAQPAPAGVEQAGNAGVDPPALAGRVAALNGAVSFHAAGETQWNAASLNYPVTNGEAFWTEPQAAATLEIADDRLVMDDSTEVDITALDQNQLVVTEAQGAVFLALNSLSPGQAVSFNTPRGTVQISAPGRYEIVAGDTNDATTVTVVEGAAHVSGSNLSLDIGPQQTATVSGTDVLQGSVGPMQQDAFLQAQLAVRSRRIAAAAPRQLHYMTGAAELQDYGSFTQTAQYGQVWYPNDVAGDWAPYRDGHWAYVQPWGWTWVDNARWGFAPFHYGRWVQVENRWGWVAGAGDDVSDTAYPVYSPALVSFVDVGGAALAGAALGFAAGELAGGYAPAWIPLGPREPYYPWYHARPDYFGRINAPYGVPRTIIDRGPTFINSVTNIRTVNNFYINRGAATVVPASAFARGQGMRDVARPLPERYLSDARPMGGRLPVRPTASTPNLSPVVARRFNVALPVTPVQPRTAGPRVVPMQSGRATPELRHASLPGNVHATPVGQVQNRPGQEGLRQSGQLPGAVWPEAGGPGHSNAAGPQIGRPSGLPSLRAPGARPEAVPPGGAVTPPRRDLEAPGRTSGAIRPAPGARLEAVPPGGAVTPPRRDLEAPGRTSGAIRPGVGSVRPGAVTGAAPGQVGRPAEPRLNEGPRVTPPPHVQEPSRGAEPRPTPSSQGSRVSPPAQVPRPAPRAEPARPETRVEAPRPAPRVETPRAPSRVEAPRAVPRVEAPRPAPRMEAPRPTPRAEAVRPEPRQEAPRPAAPPVRPVAPPRPAPAPARPAPGPAKHEPPH